MAKESLTPLQSPEFEPRAMLEAGHPAQPEVFSVQELFQNQARENAPDFPEPAFDLDVPVAIKKVTAVAGIAAVAFAGGASLANSENASAAPIHETALSKFVKVPKLKPNQTIPAAFTALRKAGLKAAGVQPVGKYPKADSDKRWVSSGRVSEKIVKTIKNGKGKKPTKIIVWKPVPVGAKEKRGTGLYVIPRQVAKPQQAVETPDLPNVETPGSPDEIGPPIAEIPVSPDVLAEARRITKENTVKLPFANGCSGFLIRDDSGNAIGVSTAQHCGLRPENLSRIRGTDGKLYAVPNGPLTVMQGENFNDMREIGEVETAILPVEGNVTNDRAILTFKGESSQKVLDADRKGLVDPAVLTPGTQVFIEGFPTSQPNNNSGVIRSQFMTSTYLGPTTVYTTTGQELPLQMVGMNANADGAICSFGNSGAEGVVPIVIQNPNGTQKVEFKKLGVNSAFDDFRGPELNTVGYDGPLVRADRELFSGFNLKNFAAWCGLDGKTLELEYSDQVTLVRSSYEIPGYEASPRMASAEAVAPPSVSTNTTPVRILKIKR